MSRKLSILIFLFVFFFTVNSSFVHAFSTAFSIPFPVSVGFASGNGNRTGYLNNDNEFFMYINTCSGVNCGFSYLFELSDSNKLITATTSVTLEITSLTGAAPIECDYGIVSSSGSPTASFSERGTATTTGTYTFDFTINGIRDHIGVGIRNDNAHGIDCQAVVKSLTFNGENLYTIYPELPSGGGSATYIPVNQYVTELECINNDPSTICTFTYSTTTASTSDYSTHLDNLLLLFSVLLFIVGILLFRFVALRFLS